MQSRPYLFLLSIGLLTSLGGVGCVAGQSYSFRESELDGGAQQPGFDSGPMSQRDAWSAPGTDAWAEGEDAAVVIPDAWVGPIDASADPLNAAARCTSGRTWGLGDRGSDQMNPGLACIACHSTRRAPRFTAAGTVYPTGHEPDLCNGGGPSPTSVTIEIRDSAGHVAMVNPNSAGNFYYTGTLTPPLMPSIHYMGRTRVMVGPAATGDCNSCHTQTGIAGAPGRITLP